MSLNASNVVIIVPTYNPSLEFPSFIESLNKKAEQYNISILVVNDGCDEIHNQSLSKAAELSKVTVIDHHCNLGKGAALKTGLKVAAENNDNLLGVITADADGQHKVEDIIKLHELSLEKPSALILGTRQFKKAVPFRSRFGNIVTKTLFYTLTGLKIEDTQTGLRFIPRVFFDDLHTISSNGYAFEMDMLLHAKQETVSIESLPIETIYIDGNKSSHFRPFVDSIKIYAVLFKQVFSSALTAIVDLTAFSLFFYYSGGMLFWANAFSRTVAFPVYYFLNRDFVFKRKSLGFHPVPKLILAIIISGLCSYALQHTVHKTIGGDATVIKLVIETFVFLVNFIVLREFVYKRKKQKIA